MAGLLFLLVAQSVHAYIDPGSGSYILQLIIAGLLGAGVAVKIYWKRIKALISGLFSRGRREEDDIKYGAVSSSFRDPSGFLFLRDGSLYRQVNVAYRADYDHLVDSGLYQSLVDSGLLVPHDDASNDHAVTDAAYMILKPTLIPFVSYPYEWCFSQLEDAALVTLAIQRRAMDFGMSLRDSSAYDIQFMDGRPVLVDTLFLEEYREGEPWVACRQFCQHFLVPLALMSHTDVRLSQLSQVYIDGIPLDLASSLLPRRTWLSFSLLTHVHFHARSQRHLADKTVDTRS